MAIELARSLLAHEPRSVAMLDQTSPCTVPSSSPPAVIAGLPAQVHLHYLKALMDWAVSQLVRQQPQASSAAATAAKNGTGTSQSPGGCRGGAAAKGGPKGSQSGSGDRIHPRDLPASWDLLMALLATGCWGGADVASSVPVSILQSAAAACQRACRVKGAVDNKVAPEAEGKPWSPVKVLLIRSSPHNKHNIFTFYSSLLSSSGVALLFSVNRCLRTLLKLPSLEPTSSGDPGHAASAPASVAEDRKREVSGPHALAGAVPSSFRPGLDLLINFTLAVLDCRTPTPKPPRRSGDEGTVQSLGGEWRALALTAIQALHGVVLGQPNTKKVRAGHLKA